MYREFFVRSPLLSLPLFALVIFMGVFAAVLLRVFGRSAKQFENQARMPLGNEEEDPREH